MGSLNILFLILPDPIDIMLHDLTKIKTKLPLKAQLG
jgi:hypothetical protein